MAQIRPKNNLLSAAARPVPENFLLDVRRLFWEATEDERIGIFRTSLNWAYKEMIVNEPAMSGRVAAKPAHIEQKISAKKGSGLRRWPSMHRKSGRDRKTTRKITACFITLLW